MRQTGTVKLFKEDKGYGFITPDAGGSDCFVHIKGVLGGRRSLSPGEKVEYDVEPGAKGPQAVRVSVFGDAAANGVDAGAVLAAPVAWEPAWPASSPEPDHRAQRGRDRRGRGRGDRPRRHWADD